MDNNHLYDDIFGNNGNKTSSNNSNNNLGVTPPPNESNSFKQNIDGNSSPGVLNQSVTPKLNNTPIPVQTVTPPPLDNFPINNSETISTESNNDKKEEITPLNEQPIPNEVSSPTINDEELLKAFIGNNYEKITTKEFNFAGFFFTTLYMFYRKMFLYTILLFIVNLVVLNVINNYFITLLFNIIVGFFVNKIYLYYAKNKIAKIKLANQDKSVEELKNICAKKGGTSFGKSFLGFLIEIGIALVIAIGMLILGISSFIGDLLNISDWDIINVNDNGSLTNGKLVENVSISDYNCINSKCDVSIKDFDGNITKYKLKVNDSDLFIKLNDYTDYIKLNIYLNSKTITSYKIYLKSNNEDISNITSEEELRSKIGLYNIGTYTSVFTLKKIGNIGAGFNDDESYTYITYTLVDSNNIEYKMKYINPDNNLNLVEGNKYNVTFEVTEGIIDYDFTIKMINN